MNVYQHLRVLSFFFMTQQFLVLLISKLEVKKAFLCLLDKSSEECLTSTSISLEERHGSQLLNASVCVHLFVYFFKCNWEDAWKQKSIAPVHSKQI